MKSLSSDKENAVRDLIKSGAPFESIQALIGPDVKIVNLIKDVFEKEAENRDFEGL